MCCGQKFQSEGAHNRMCNSCRALESSPYEPDFGSLKGSGILHFGSQPFDLTG